MRNDQCRLPRGDVVEEDDELISTHASGGVTRPQHGANAQRHIDEQPITGGMAQGIVDHLEVVEIEEQDRETGLAPVCEAQAVGQTVPEEGAVRQAGQLVVERSVAKFCRGDGELGRSVSDPALDLVERRFDLLAEEVDAGRDGIDDVPIRADLGAGAEPKRGELLDGSRDVF
ncbi:MAG TPA: hypothetical protein VIJ45_04410 [Coriobacteriia bacterium]